MKRWLTILLALAALALPGAARAATSYVFPGTLPAGCSGTGPSYTCAGNLSLGAGDTVTINSPKPATITIGGGLTLSSNNQINQLGSASDLTLTVSGTLTLGFNAKIKANITAASVADPGGGSVTITGDLTATGGNIYMAYQGSVTGNVSTSGTGTITTAQNGSVGGNVSGGTGSISIGQNSTVAGNVTGSGAITVIQQAIVSGNVDTTSGAVSLGFQSRVNGNVDTTGTITLAQESRVGGTVTGGAGNVSLGYQGTVVGALTTTTGTISLAQSSVTSSCVKSTGGASITLGYQASVNSVCCGSSCSNSCVTNNSTYAMPPACTASTPTVDHYELSVPSANVSCLASTVTVTACADSSSPCTNPVTTAGFAGQSASLATTAGTLGSSTVTFGAGGTATTTLSHAGASDGATATVTLSGETTTAASPRKCCLDGTSCSAANSCTAAFKTAGFIVASSANGAAATVPPQTAGVSSSWVLRAVKTGTSTKACEPALSGTTTVNWGLQCNDPTTCSSGNRMAVSGVAIAGNANGSSAASTAVSMTFDSNGNAPFSFSYADAGRVTLLASKAAGGSLLTALSGSSNAFVVTPARFLLSGIRCASYAAGSCATAAIASPGNNPAAGSAAGSAFLPAGKPFTVTVTAVDSTGNATPNFGRETSPEGVKLTANLVQPSGGTAAALTNPTAFGTFSGGVATGNTFAWPEVGIITLTPSVADGDYLGAGNVSGTASGNVGRFIPAGFAISSASRTHRLDQSCAADPGFTYMDENFRLAFTLTAQNASGATTTNYTGSFALLDLATDTKLKLAGIDGSTQFKTSDGSLVLSGATGSWNNGVASGATVTAKVPRLSTTPVGPYANADFGIAPVDPDGVAILSLDLDTDSVGGADRAKVGRIPLRFGRLRLQNAIAPASRTLSLPLEAQYWTGTAYNTNTSDSCSRINATNLSFGNLRKTLVAGDAAMVGSSVTLVSGKGSITLAAPNSGHVGSLDVAIALDTATPPADLSCLKTQTTWTPAKAATVGASLFALRGPWCGTAFGDPGARATWGLLRGANGVIYQTENY